MREKIPERIHSLDIIRGIAALSVVVFHWQVFFYEGYIQSDSFDRLKQPFFEILSVIYAGGGLAVDLFFCISGFVFYWLYQNQIYIRKINPKKFFVLRFSRLYPLHFITLCTVTILQTIVFYKYGDYFIYKFNDIYHFSLHLMFASHWGLQIGDSFNGPVWSVSIEIILYFLFFIVSYFNKQKKIILSILIFIGLILSNIFAYPIGRGIYSFFIGGLIFFQFKKILFKERNNKYIIFIFSLMTFSWFIIFFEVNTNFIYKFLFEKISSIQNLINGNTLVFIIKKSFYLIIVSFVFPLTLLFFSLAESKKILKINYLKWIGDISYSSYLIHFPLQLICILIIKEIGLSNVFFYNEVFFLTFFVILIILSLISYHKIEKKIQKFIRENFT